MRVYCLFCTVGDGDSYSRFELLDVFSCLEVAKNAARNLFENQIFQFPENQISFVHNSMNFENFGTYIGSRDDCDEMCTDFGGYVIEERNLI